MSKFFRILFLLGLCCYLPSVFAQGGFLDIFSPTFGAPGESPKISYTPSFTPPPTDLSVSYLGQVFGTVGTVLHGTSGQMLGQLFKIFNIGILVVAGIFLIYTIIMTVLTTAHEGEFMGRKWNSGWIALRTVLGLGLLVPSATTGYSTVQVIVMWVVLQGVGFANMAWATALTYLQNNGRVYTAPSTETGTLVDMVGSVLSMQVCMYYAQNVEKQSQKNLAANQQQSQSTTNTAPPPPAVQNVTNFAPLFTTVFESNQFNSVVKFPGNAYASAGQQDNTCGQLNFGANANQATLQGDQRTNTIKAAVRQIMLNTDGYAKQIADQAASNPNFSTQMQSAIVGAAADWINITLPLRTLYTKTKDTMYAQYLKLAVQQGWIMAGRYYYALGNITAATDSASDIKVNIDNAPAGLVTPSKGAYITFSGSPAFNATTLANLKGFSDADKTSYTNMLGKQGVTGYVQSSRNVAAQVDQAGKVSLNIGNAGILGFFLSPLTSVLLMVIGKLTSAIGDPIVILQVFGYSFLAVASALWLGGTVAAFAAGLAGSAVASINPFPFGFDAAVLAFIPVFTAFVLIFFALGATMAFYIPLVPFIIFAFSAAGWLITVIEAMVAAPLVALGITHPEGHDLLGKGEQAIMLLLSVFLRPVLMIIGLFAGMILSIVLVRFLNSGFFGIVFDVGNFNLFAFVSVLIIYCSLVVTIVNQAYSLIYVVPDRVMRWIGVTEQGGSAAPTEALQGAKQGAEQYHGQIQSSGGQLSGEAIKTDRDSSRRKQEAAQKSQSQLPSSGGTSGTGSKKQ